MPSAVTISAGTEMNTAPPSLVSNSVSKRCTGIGRSSPYGDHTVQGSDSTCEPRSLLAAGDAAALGVDVLCPPLLLAGLARQGSHRHCGAGTRGIVGYPGVAPGALFHRKRLGVCVGVGGSHRYFGTGGVTRCAGRGPTARHRSSPRREWDRGRLRRAGARSKPRGPGRPQPPAFGTPGPIRPAAKAA